MIQTRATPKRMARKNYFREWREHLGLTQDRALERLPGWSQSKLSRIEGGKIIWNALDLADLEVAYGKAAHFLLSVHPEKEGEVVDLLQIINDKNREQAIRVLRALSG